MSRRKKRVVSLFSGCGGMDLGFEGNFEVFKASINHTTHKHWVKHCHGNKVTLAETSFETVFANDILDYAKSSWVPFFSERGADKGIFHTESIVDLVKRHKSDASVFPDNIDVITGGFPCQDFSLSGNRLGFDSNKNHRGAKIKPLSKTSPGESRGSLYIWMKEVIEITKPKVFIAENVKGLVSLGNVKEIIENDFRSVDQGYIVVPAKVLNAKDYGVPQNRERIIFIGLNKKYLTQKSLDSFETGRPNENIFPYPPATHGPLSKAEDPNLLAYVDLKTIFQDLNEPDQEISDLDQQSYSKAKYYGKMQGNTEIKPHDVGPTIRSEHHGNIEFRRLSKDHGGTIHDEIGRGLKERRLTIRECARIQTFPDNYRFVRPRKKGQLYPLSASGAYKVIGNAVPPLLAYHLARRLEDIWSDLFGDP